MSYMVLGHMRSGSSTINESLEMHPNLKVAYEIFHPSASIENTNIPDINIILKSLFGFNKWNTDDSVLSCRWGRKPDEIIFPKSGEYNIGSYRVLKEDRCLEPFVDFVLNRYDGFKILYNQLKRNYKIWDYLLSKNLKVIHIYRKNYLDSLVSLYVAHSSKKWQSKNGETTKDSRFRIEPHIAEEYFYSMDFEIEHFTSMFSNSISIEYEDLFHWDTTSRKIQSFLEIPIVKLEQKYSKRNIAKPSELIINFEELKSVFINSKWKHLFEGKKKLFI